MMHKYKIAKIVIVIGLILLITWEYRRFSWTPLNREDYKILSFSQDMFDSIRFQLFDLKDKLKAYKESHNYYPDNDLGLAILSDYKLRDKVLFETESCDEAVWFGYITFFDNSSIYRNFLPAIRNNNNHFYWWRVSDSSYSDNESNKKKKYLGEYTLIICDSDKAFLLDQEYPVDPYMLLPYIYENRNMANTPSFSYSIVNQDKASDYSLCVDKGIYIYSLAGYYYARECDRINNIIRKRSILLWIILIGIQIPILILLLRIKWLGRYPFIKLILLMAGYNLIVFIFIQPFIPSRSLTKLLNARLTEVVNIQNNIYDQYYQEKILSKESYDSKIEALQLNYYP